MKLEVNPQINPFQLPLEVKYDKRQPLDLMPFGNKFLKSRFKGLYLTYPKFVTTVL